MSRTDSVPADRLLDLSVAISPFFSQEEALSWSCFRAREVVFFRIVLLDQLEIR
jgi:hypothetical protein